MTDPAVLILDDATSSVDTRTEEQIHATLREVMAGRTTIVVAHRRSTLQLARAHRAGRRRPGRGRGHPRRAARARPRCTATCSRARARTVERGRRGATLGVAASRRGGGRGRRSGPTRSSRRHAGSLWPARRRDASATPRPWSRRRTAPATRMRPAAGRRGGGAAVVASAGMALSGDARAAGGGRPRSRRPTPRPRSTSTPRRRPDDGFTLRRFLRPYRRPLGIGLGARRDRHAAHARRARSSSRAGLEPGRRRGARPARSGPRRPRSSP